MVRNTDRVWSRQPSASRPLGVRAAGLPASQDPLPEDVGLTEAAGRTVLGHGNTMFEENSWPMGALTDDLLGTRLWR